MKQHAKNTVIQQLQKEIISLQGYGVDLRKQHVYTGLDEVEKSFPNGKFPTGAIHELLSLEKENATATNGFISGLLGNFLKSDGSCVWISTRRTIFPPALKLFGISPERIVFIDLANDKEVLWALEEALKCEALSAVVGELREISFTQSRRLQLAVEQSRVTGFLHRYAPRSENTIACVSRWRIASLPSVSAGQLPGLGFPRWNVQLLKARNGKPGSWQVEWTAQGFQHIPLFSPSVNRRFITKTA